jgi:hypothetical protein
MTSHIGYREVVLAVHKSEPEARLERSRERGAVLKLVLLVEWEQGRVADAHVAAASAARKRVGAGLAAHMERASEGLAVQRAGPATVVVPVRAAAVLRLKPEVVHVRLVTQMRHNVGLVNALRRHAGADDALRVAEGVPRVVRLLHAPVDECIAEVDGAQREHVLVRHVRRRVRV